MIEADLTVSRKTLQNSPHMTSTSVKMAHDSSAAPRTLLLRLKDETRDVHESLERDLDLLRPDLTLDRYRGIVERSLRVFTNLGKNAVDSFAGRPVFPALSNRVSRFRKLVDDLAFLGAKPAKLSLCRNLPACRLWPQVLGGLYVTGGRHTEAAKLSPVNCNRCWACLLDAASPFFQATVCKWDRCGVPFAQCCKPTRRRGKKILSLPRPAKPLSPCTGGCASRGDSAILRECRRSRWWAV